MDRLRRGDAEADQGHREGQEQGAGRGGGREEEQGRAVVVDAVVERRNFFSR